MQRKLQQVMQLVVKVCRRECYYTCAIYWMPKIQSLRWRRWCRILSQRVWWCSSQTLRLGWSISSPWSDQFWWAICVCMHVWHVCMCVCLCVCMWVYVSLNFYCQIPIFAVCLKYAGREPASFMVDQVWGSVSILQQDRLQVCAQPSFQAWRGVCVCVLCVLECMFMHMYSTVCMCCVLHACLFWYLSQKNKKIKIIIWSVFPSNSSFSFFWDLVLLFCAIMCSVFKYNVYISLKFSIIQLLFIL